MHRDWGEIDPPTFDRQIVAQVVQNEMLAAIGPIDPARTNGNSSEGIDISGPGTGAVLEPPQGRTPIPPVNTGR